MRMTTRTITVFVGGPIQHALNSMGFNQSLRQVIVRVIEALEADGFGVFSAHRDEEFGAVDTRGKSAWVTKRDFLWMNSCDVFVAILPSLGSSLLRTDGTFIELGWASALRKPIVMVLCLESECSHLVSGLGAVTNVLMLDFDEVVAAPELLIRSVRRIVEDSVQLTGT
jgi:nucleoside 2-deoxyribosyltransferase